MVYKLPKIQKLLETEAGRALVSDSTLRVQIGKCMSAHVRYSRMKLRKSAKGEFNFSPWTNS